MVGKREFVFFWYVSSHVDDFSNTARLHWRMGVHVRNQPPHDAEYPQYVLESAKNYNDEPEIEFESWDEDHFLAQLTKETERVSSFTNGHYKAVFDFYVGIKLHVLQRPRASWYYNTHGPRLDYHEMYDERIAKMLGYKFGQNNDHANGTYVNAAKSCRDVQERMKLTECRATFSKEECI
jgi:hypothetical protein